jgi:hypothetical protein
MQQETKNCQNCKKDFTIEPDDFAFYDKIKVPAPAWCPNCRAQRRILWRNEHFLYKRKSDFSGKEIFSAFSPEFNGTVYENDAWFGDQWNSLDYGIDLDFSKPFLSQFKELLEKVPRKALEAIRAVNSDFCNNVTAPKNCFLIFNSTLCEDCMYGNGVDNSKDCIDVSHVSKGEIVYDSFWLTRVNRVYFSVQCEDSSDIYFSKNLRGCMYCFGCVNLRNKKYHIFNKPYTKEEYSKELEKYDVGSYGALQKIIAEVKNFWLLYPNKFMEGTHNTNVSGEYISYSKNVKDSYFVREGENLRYCQYLYVPQNKDCYDHSIWGAGNELTYECDQCGTGTNNIRFCEMCYPNIKNLEYCAYCGSSSDLFGCVGVRNKQYCILNKQYSKEEYEALIPKIISHMKDMPHTDKKQRVYKYGEFFPSEFSPFAYNETIAQEHFPLTKEMAIEKGYSWRDMGERNYKITMQPKNLPDHIKDVADTITQEVIGCEHKGECNDGCTVAFRITQRELDFYRKANLPLPRLCFYCRLVEREKQRNSIRLWKRQCMCDKSNHGHEGQCVDEFETAYSPDRPEIVYCESCYNEEVA